MSEDQGREKQAPHRDRVKPEEQKKYPPALGWALLSLLAESNGNENNAGIIVKTLQSDRIEAGKEERQALKATAQIIRTGKFDENNLLDMAVAANASQSGGSLRKCVAALAQHKVQVMFQQGGQADAVAYITNLSSIASDHVPELRQLCDRVLSSAGLGLLAGNKREKLAEQWEDAFRSNPKNWAIAHGLALLYWWWAVAEEKKMLGHEAKQTKSSAQAQIGTVPNSGSAFSPWSKAIGYWMYLIGPCRNDFQTWFLNERKAHCGFSANEEQITSAWNAIREQISVSIHQFADAHDERKHKGRAALMQMLAAQMQVEERFVHLFQEELLPYIKERNDPSINKAVAEVTVAGPSVLGVLNKTEKLVNVFNLIEARPPAKAKKGEENAENQLSELIGSILSGNKSEKSLDLSDINEVLRSPGTRMTRKHEGALSKCEELAIFCTPLGPLFFMAQGGSPSEVTSLVPGLPSEWQTSHLAKHILALAYKRAGKIAAGRGIAGLNDAVAHWTAAIDKWRQQEAEKHPRTSAGLTEFLERRLSGMISRERNDLLINIHSGIKSACENRINTAETQKDWALLDEPLQYINRVYQMLIAQGLSSEKFNGFYADTLRKRALIRYGIASAEKAPPANKQITLMQEARNDLLRAAEVYPTGAAHYKDEAAILSSNIANILYKQADSDGAERELRQAINLSADKNWKSGKKKDLATVLHNKGVKLYNESTDANRSIALLEEAHKLDPSSQEIQEHLDTLKQLRNSSRSGSTYHTGGTIDSDQALKILEGILRSNPSDRQAREYLEALKRMKGKGW